MNETIFTSPKAYAELQTRMANAVLEAADESAKHFENALQQIAKTYASAMHENAERSIEAMNIAMKFRAKSVGIAKDAIALQTSAAAK